MNVIRKGAVVFAVVLLTAVLFSYAEGNKNYRTENGEVIFMSAAPQEIIQASSTKLVGVLNPTEKTFRFGVSMITFAGFNSSQQQEHFNENYIESALFPKANFVGKIVEDIDMTVPGTYNIRAKGKLEVHGVKVSKTIKCKLIVGKDYMTIRSKFSVTLNDFDMSVPSVVKNKLAEEINVTVNAKMKIQ
ncbi:MAG: hypothetical protein ACJAZ2_000156 [Glaciecola sp.]|jgi:hypothetical protein